MIMATCRESGNVNNLITSRSECANDADWQTVTTGIVCDRIVPIDDIAPNETGSSVADVSDSSSYYEMYGCEHGSTERFTQFPYENDTQHSYVMNFDKKIESHIPGRATESRAIRPAHWSVNKPPRPAARVAAAVRQLSSTLGSPHQRKRVSEIFEMKTLSTSYKSLGSNTDQHHGFSGMTEASAKRVEQGDIRWNRVHRDLGRDCPKTPLTILDQCLYKRELMDTSYLSPPPYKSHDEFLHEIPRLPFPLISLPEAAKLQHFRRERGEEDHTDPAGSFAAKARSGTLSTVSSNNNSPRTPLSVEGYLSLQPPSAVHSHGKSYRHYASKSSLSLIYRLTSNSAVASFDSTPERVPSSTILGFTFPTRPPTSAVGSIYNTQSRRVSNLGPKLLRLRGRSSIGTTRIKNTHARFGQSLLFTPSEADLMESAREDILFRRRFSDDEEERQRLIFLVIMVITIFFPLIGLLALWGKFDATITWYTHGEMHCLTQEQRATLKQQLLVELVLYPLLIISLTVYFSVHR